LRADIDYGTATAHTTVGTIGVKVWVYRGEVVSSGQISGDRIAAEADLATGGPARRTQKSIKSRAEEAAGAGERKPRLIEAGGGKRLVESGGPAKEGGRRLIEAGGGRRPTAAEAKVEYESAVEDVEVVEGAPGADTPAPEEAEPTPAAEATEPTPTEAGESTASEPTEPTPTEASEPTEPTSADESAEEE
jgi:small subunit ribosomal protein S3